MNAQQIIDTENKHTSGVYAKQTLTIVRGRGASLFDVDGVEYLDCSSGHGVANLGHAHPKIAEALYKQANTLITHGANTMVQQAIAENPAMVIVNLGVNDLGLRVEGRTLAQCQSDCNIALNALRAGLPSAVIVVPRRCPVSMMSFRIDRSWASVVAVAVMLRSIFSTSTGSERRCRSPFACRR